MALTAIAAIVAAVPLVTFNLSGGFPRFAYSSQIGFGVLAAVLSVVPFGGTALVWVPALATLLIQGSYGQAVGILVVGVIVSSVVAMPAVG